MTFPQSPPRGAPPGGNMPQQASDLLLVLILSLIGLKFLPPLLIGLFFDRDPGSGKIEDASRVLALAVLYITHSLVILACVRAYALRRYGLTWRDLGAGPFEKRHFKLGLAAGLLAVPAVLILSLLVEAWLGHDIENPQLEILAPIGSSLGAFLLIAGLGSTVVPFAEEIAFRGLLYQWLRQRWGIQVALIVSAVFFAVMHEVPEIIPAITALGIIFAALLQITRSIWPAVVAHGTFNFVMTAFLYFELSGQGGATAALLLAGGP